MIVSKLSTLNPKIKFIAVTKQLYKWCSPSICLLVTPFSLCSHHGIVMKFSGVIIIDRSDAHADGGRQRSKVKVTEVKTNLAVSGL